MFILALVSQNSQFKSQLILCCCFSYQFIDFPCCFNLTAIQLISSKCRSCSSISRLSQFFQPAHFCISNVNIIVNKQNSQQVKQLIRQIQQARFTLYSIYLIRKGQLLWAQISLYIENLSIILLTQINMSASIYPVPPSHRTFQFGSVVIDSNFDSGNCSQAERVSNTSYNIWIGTDNPKNNYRTWFHFSIRGLSKGVMVNFKIKNMQNQSRLLNQGLVPVFREENSQDWKRIKQKVNTNAIEFCDGWIQWSFKHTMTSDEKVFFAFFYPWSNEDNQNFINVVHGRCKNMQNVYFHKSSIAKSLQGRPINFLTISSRRGLQNKQEPFEDKNLFQQEQRPNTFNCDKKCIVIGARVHPGQVPASHVMTGIIDQITQDSQLGNLLRDKFIFYIIPIFNPDGVARGHYRVDTNGINLNRCYINPNPKDHSPIYAVKKWIMYLHQKNRFFAFLDLHAHASRKGVFIYGNAINQLEKQVDTCIFPKILSMNSADFQYQGSNFTQKNMYCKDKADHASKQGSGRVAMFKATKNAYCWTLECNYNSSLKLNVLQDKKNPDQAKISINQNTLDQSIIVPYKEPQNTPAKQFYTIQTYRKLGKQICQSFLDLIQCNPHSRIQNPKSYYKSIQNLKMNLAIALLRMAPNRFESNYKKIYYGVQSKDNEALKSRSIQALYYILIRKVKINNLSDFLKNDDRKGFILPTNEKNKQKQQSPMVKRNLSLRAKQSLNLKLFDKESASMLKSSRQNTQNQQQNQSLLEEEIEMLKKLNSIDDSRFKQLIQTQVHVQNGTKYSIGCQQTSTSQKFSYFSGVPQQQQRAPFMSKVILHVQQFKMIGLKNLRSSFGTHKRPKGTDQYNFRNSKQVKLKFQQLPMLQSFKVKPSIHISSLGTRNGRESMQASNRQYRNKVHPQSSLITKKSNNFLKNENISCHSLKTSQAHQ